MNRDDALRWFKTTRSRATLRQGRNEWYRIENQVDRTEIYVLDEIGYFGVNADDFVRDLRAVQSPVVELHLNSPGGSAFDGIALFNALRDHPARVEVVVDGMAASAASVIAMSGDLITMNTGSQLMIHDGHGLAIGNASDMRDMADILDRTSNGIAQIYAERAGGNVTAWRELMQRETWYDAQEAVTAGLADQVRGGQPTENSFDLSIYAHAGRQHAPAPPLNPQPPENPAFVLDPDAFRAAVKEAIVA